MSTKLLGPLTVEELDERAERFARLVERRMRTVVNASIPFLDQTVTASARWPSDLRKIAHPVLIAAVSPDDVNPLKSRWQQVVDDDLLAELGDEFFAGVTSTAAALASAGFGAPLFDESLAAQKFMEQARNRLVQIGDDLWSDARTQLTEGLRLGESVPQLADRVRDSVDVATPRATTIARTEVIGASNAGSITTMRESGLVTRKEWISTLDDRTRETHVAAMGQIVDLGDPFSIGGAPLDHPGDPNGPPEEIINCRCVMGYEVGEPDEPDPEVTPETIASGRVTIAAAKDFTDGCMIALIPTEEDAKKISLDDGSPIDELHVTLAYLGKISDGEVTDQIAKESRAIVADLAEGAAFDYVPTQVAGIGTLGSEDPPALVLFLNGEVLDIVHEELLHRMDESESEFRAQFRPWIPHLTLGYGNDPSEVDLAGEEISFDRLRIAIGDEVVDYELRDTIR